MPSRPGPSGFAKSLFKRLPLPLKKAARSTAAIVYRKNLNMLALLCLTDKWGSHWYTQHYQRYFARLRKQKINLLEIGVGGYEDSERGGGSLRMWKAYFPKGKIVGVDICDKTHFAEHRIDIRVGDQTNAAMLTRISSEYGGFDIIIDDGSHLSHHIIQTFHILFPLLKPDGIYAIEDTQTAYWPGWGGGMNDPNSSTAFVKQLTDGLNYSEYPVRDYDPSYFDKNIVEIAFFHNLIFIRKGSNDEATNDPALVLKETEVAEAMDKQRKAAVDQS